MCFTCTLHFAALDNMVIFLGVYISIASSCDENMPVRNKTASIFSDRLFP